RGRLRPGARHQLVGEEGSKVQPPSPRGYRLRPAPRVRHGALDRGAVHRQEPRPSDQGARGLRRGRDRVSPLAQGQRTHGRTRGSCIVHADLRPRYGGAHGWHRDGRDARLLKEQTVTGRKWAFITAAAAVLVGAVALKSIGRREPDGPWGAGYF